MDKYEGSLKKELGLVTLVTIGVGSVIGSGIYAMPAVMAASAGPSLVLSIVIAAVVTIFLSLVYAELGAAFPLTGGPYVFPRLAMGDLAGFVIGWGYFIYLFTGTAAIIDIFVAYLGFYVPGLTMSGGALTSSGIAIAVAMLWIFTVINILGVRWGGLFSIVTTFGKLIPLFIFVIAGAMFASGANFSPFMPFGPAGMTFAVTLFFWSYIGFEAVVVPCGEVHSPARTIPLAMFLTVIITTAVYLLVSSVFVGMINWEGMGLAVQDWVGIGKLRSPLSDISLGAGLPWLAALAMIGAMISTAGCGGNWVLLQGRVPFAMASDGLFWRPLGRVHERFGTPHVSLIFVGLLTTIVMIAIPHFPSVALIASITVLVPYAMAALALPILRKTKAETERPFKLPLHFALSLIAFVLSSFLIYWGSWPWTLVGTALIFIGYPIYFAAKRDLTNVRQNVWLPVYLAGMTALSILGDPKFEFNNFTPLKPLGILTAPYDLLAIALFAAVIFFWGYLENINLTKGPASPIEPSDN